MPMPPAADMRRFTEPQAQTRGVSPVAGAPGSDQDYNMPKIAETVEGRKKRSRKIVRALRKLYPEADCALRHENPLQLLVATILSAQSTDRTVNNVAPVLFRRFKTARALAGASREQVEEIIHSTGFFRQKAKSIQGACRRIVEEFGGKIREKEPSSRDRQRCLP